eukprot:1593986-Amphidinium_carterae.1
MCQESSQKSFNVQQEKGEVVRMWNGLFSAISHFKLAPMGNSLRVSLTNVQHAAGGIAGGNICWPVDSKRQHARKAFHFAGTSRQPEGNRHMIVYVLFLTLVVNIPSLFKMK